MITVGVRTVTFILKFSGLLGIMFKVIVKVMFGVIIIFVFWVKYRAKAIQIEILQVSFKINISKILKFSQCSKHSRVVCVYIHY